MKMKEATQNRLIAFAVLLLMFGFLLIKFNFNFYTNDDCLLESMLSGSYSGTPEAHNVYHMYPLAWIITVFYRVIPALPWYGIFLFLAQFGALYLCLVRCAKIAAGIVKKLTFCVTFSVLYVGIMMPEMVLLQYTITSAMMAAVSIFLLITDSNRETELKRFILKNIPILLIYGMAFALRRQVGILFLPFFLGACLYKWIIDESEESGKKLLLGYAAVLLMVGITALYHRGFLFYITVGLAVAVCVWTIVVCAKGRRQRLSQYLLLIGSLFAIMGVIWGIDTLEYSSPEWKDYRAFNEVRTGIYDFGDIPYYQENEQVYQDAGLTEGDQILLRRYDIALSDRINTASLESLNNFQKDIYGADYSIRHVKIMIEYAIRRVIENIDMPYGAILLGLYLFAFLLFILTKRYAGMIELVYIIALRVGCWCYLFVRDRFPDRVTHGLYLVEILFLLGLCIRQIQQSGHRRRKLYAYIMETACLITGIYCFVTGVTSMKEGTPYRSDLSKNWEAVRTYCESNETRFYILDTLSFANYTQPVFHLKKRVENYTLAGGWGVNTLPYYEKLKLYSMGDTLPQAIASGRSVYFIQKGLAEDIEWLEFCLKQEDNNIEIIPVDVIVGEESYGVYKIN